MRALVCLLLCTVPAPAQPKNEYVKKPTQAATAQATLAAFGLPNLSGKWHYVGPFSSDFDVEHPPEKNADLKATYTDRFGKPVGWKELPKFEYGQIYDLLNLFPDAKTESTVYLQTEFESTERFRLPLSLGSDDTLSVFVNGERILHEKHERAAAPDQDLALVKVRPGKNTLMLRIGQYGGQWDVYARPGLPDSLPPAVLKQFDKDFPATATATPGTATSAEAKFYPVTTMPQPADCVLEVGGLGFRPDGKLLACTRRGDVWLIGNPGGPPSAMTFTRFATGLHEALGLHVVDNNTVYVVQRPELSKLTDTHGTGTADAFATVCDKWGVSGDYHEFAFGPARDKDGNFFITLNVGFGGGHQAKSPWRGWCVKVTPKGDMEPWAYGLRSPNGINFAPDGELFYCDNQGEWVATNKMNHLKKGKFYGHQAGLKWLKDSPFAGTAKDKIASGMLYDGQPGPTGAKGFPELDPPCIWFPYGRMGQSVTEPKWDTTAGKFGPFAGQCFVGDQTRSSVMRVALEKVNGVYQGACFPFRSGLQCGVNRIAFGPDGAMYVGQTARGWGSVGGKPYGLQRLNYAGAVPLEVHTMALRPGGFDLTFTKPIAADSATVKNLALKSFTYVYSSNYGCPETDTRPEKIASAKLSADGRTLSLAVPDLARGRLYDLRLSGVHTADGEELLHGEAYYTLNELPRE